VQPLTEADLWLVDPSNYIDEETDYREYHCPGDGLTMEKELLLADGDQLADKEVDWTPSQPNEGSPPVSVGLISSPDNT
jgi:hypothetical protein